jgi:hypothetical protein
VISAEDYAARVVDANAMVVAGSDIESVLRFLKISGFSPIDSIRALMELTGWTLAEATRKVHFSEAWKELSE